MYGLVEDFAISRDAIEKIFNPPPLMDGFGPVLV